MCDMGSVIIHGLGCSWHVQVGFICGKTSKINPVKFSHKRSYLVHSPQQRRESGATKKDGCEKNKMAMLCFDLLTRPKMPFKVMHRKEVTHSNCSCERKSRGRKLADEMGRARKIPMVHYRVMHRKRETSELHDSYFRLMTIKHSISKIEWASNDYIIELSSGSS